MTIALGTLLSNGDVYVARFDVVVDNIPVEYTYTFEIASPGLDISSPSVKVDYTNLKQLANGAQTFRAQFGKTEFKMNIINDVEIRGTLDNRSGISMATNGPGVWAH